MFPPGGLNWNMCGEITHLPERKIHQMKKEKSTSYIIYLILLIGVFLRLWHLDAKSMRLEEQMLRFMIRGDWRNLLDYFKELGYGWNPLNPFICWLADKIPISRVIFRLRLPSAVFGTFSIYALYRLGKTLFSEKTGIIAAALLALSPMAVAYSQEGRYFGLGALLSILSALFLLDTLDRKRGWIGFVLIQAAILLTTYQGGAFLVMEGVYLFLPVIFHRLWQNDDQDPLKSFIFYLVSMVAVFLLISPWLYYEISYDFRLQKILVDIHASGGSYKDFLDWGGGNFIGFLFCLFFFFQGIWGQVKDRRYGRISDRNTKIHGCKTASGFLLPVLLAAVPIVSISVGILRRDQIFFALAFFLLIVAEGMNRTAVAFRDKTSRHRLIIPGLLTAYLFLQVVAFYNLETNRKLSFIPKPNWKDAANYVARHFRDGPKVLLENERDTKSISKYLFRSFVYLTQKEKTLEQIPYSLLEPIYVQRDILETLSRKENRKGFFIQTPNRGVISALLDNPVFRPHFSLAASFSGLTVYQYHIPPLVQQNTQFLYNKKYNNMILTRGQDFKKPVLFLEAGDYLVAVKTTGKIRGQFSVSVNGKETAEISTDSSGIGTFPIHARQGLTQFLFRLNEPDSVRLEWFGVHKLYDNRMVFNAEKFHYKIKKNEYWIQRLRVKERESAALFVKGSVGYYFALKRGGKFQLDLYAINDNPGPVEIAVELDGKRVGILVFDKNDYSWGRQQMVFSTSAGLHNIAFSFLNDLKNDYEDRNAFLDRFELNSNYSLDEGNSNAKH